MLVQVNRQCLEIFLPRLHQVIREAAEFLKNVNTSALVRAASPCWPLIERLYRNDVPGISLKDIECLDKIYRRFGWTVKDITISTLGLETVCKFHSSLRGAVEVRLVITTVDDCTFNVYCAHDHSEPLNLVAHLTFFDDDHKCYVLESISCVSGRHCVHTGYNPWLRRRLLDRAMPINYAAMLRLQDCTCKECSYWR